MIIKKFQGKTEAEATNLAKNELGEGVVIMNVRNVKKKGIFAFFQSPAVEVTVALEEERENRPIEQPKAERKGSEDKKQNLEEINAIGEKLDNLQTLLEQRLNTVEADLKTEKEENDKAKLLK